MLDSDSDHFAFHQSTQYQTVVRSKACENYGGQGLELSVESSVA